jgi:hypothetical protein
MVANSFLQKKVRYEYLIGRSVIKIKLSLLEANSVTTVYCRLPTTCIFLQKSITDTNSKLHEGPSVTKVMNINL